MLQTMSFRVSAVALFLAASVLLGQLGCESAGDRSPMPPQIALGDGAPSIMARGRALAIRKCMECHRFYWPREHPAEAWPRIIRRMGRMTSLRERQIRDLEMYFQRTNRRHTRADVSLR